MAKFILCIVTAFIAVISTPTYAANDSPSITASNGGRYELSEANVTHLRPGESAQISDAWCGEPVYTHWFYFDITCTSARVVEATKSGISETGGETTTKTRVRTETAGGFIGMFAMLLAVIFATAFFRQTTKLGKNIMGSLVIFALMTATCIGAVAIVMYGYRITLIFALATFVAGMVALLSGDTDNRSSPNKRAFYWAAATYEVLMALFLFLVW